MFFCEFLFLSFFFTKVTIENDCLIFDTLDLYINLKKIDILILIPDIFF